MASRVSFCKAVRSKYALFRFALFHRATSGFFDCVFASRNRLAWIDLWMVPIRTPPPRSSIHPTHKNHSPAPPPSHPNPLSCFLLPPPSQALSCFTSSSPPLPLPLPSYASSLSSFTKSPHPAPHPLRAARTQLLPSLQPQQQASRMLCTRPTRRTLGSLSPWLHCIIAANSSRSLSASRRTWTISVISTQQLPVMMSRDSAPQSSTTAPPTSSPCSALP